MPAIEVRADEDEDWAEVARLADDLQAQLEADRSTVCPEILDHYLDDVDIRAQDDRFAKRQRERARPNRPLCYA